MTMASVRGAVKCDTVHACQVVAVVDNQASGSLYTALRDTSFR